MKTLAEYIKTDLPLWPTWINAFLLRCNFFKGMVYGKGYLQMRVEIEKIDPDKRLLEIVNFAIEHVPYYRKRYGNLRIKSKKEFEEKIGFIDKEEVMQNWDDFLVDNIDWTKCFVGTTGGTSGKPLKLVIPKSRYIYNMAFWHKELHWYGWNYDTKGVIRNHHLPANRDYIINPIKKEIIFDAFRIDDSYAKKILKILKKKKVEYIHAYPSAIYQFLKLCYNQNLDTSFIKACFLSSEGVTKNQRHFIQDELGIKIYSFYGHSEMLIKAGSCPQCESYHIQDSYGYCEIIDEQGKVISDPNKLGELVGTTFYNEYFPLIRYKTGDFSSYAQSPCPVHKDYHRFLNEVLGRWDKSNILREDGTYTSVTALNLHNDVYEHIDGIQYIQDEVGKIKILIIKNKLYTHDDEKYIINSAERAMKKEGSVTIEYVDKLILQNNGKFLPLINNLKK